MTHPEFNIWEKVIHFRVIEYFAPTLPSPVRFTNQLISVLLTGKELFLGFNLDWILKFGVSHVRFLLAHGQSDQTPQRLPVLHAALELLPSESDAPSPPIFDEKVDIFFLTCSLPQTGQRTPFISLPKIKSSKD
jgi:hypothetical protein